MLLLKSRMALTAAGIIYATTLPGWAMTPNEVVNAVNAAHVLGQDIAVRAAVDADKVYVSTFRNPENNERDTKIDAILIAKAVYEASKDSLARIIVRFYGMGDTSVYQDVSISAGDIKAFAAGQTSQEQMLSSIESSKGKVPTKIDAITNDLVSTAYGDSDFRVARRGDDELVIAVDRSPWVSDEKCKIDALAYATKYAAIAPEGIQRVSVAFVDRNGKADTRQVTFLVSALPSAWKTVQNMLNMFQMRKQSPAVDAQALSVKDGPQKEARAELLAKLQELDKKGIGLAPFIRAFQGIEQQVNTVDEATLKASVDRLMSSLADQEKAYAAAKDAAAHKSSSTGTQTANGGGFENITSDFKHLPVPRYSAAGTEPFLQEKAYANPVGYLQERQQRLGGVSGPKFINLKTQVAALLRLNGRESDAAQVERTFGAGR